MKNTEQLLSALVEIGSEALQLYRQRPIRSDSDEKIENLIDRLFVSLGNSELCSKVTIRSTEPLYVTHCDSNPLTGYWINARGGVHVTFIHTRLFDFTNESDGIGVSICNEGKIATD